MLLRLVWDISSCCWPCTSTVSSSSRSSLALSSAKCCAIGWLSDCLWREVDTKVQAARQKVSRSLLCVADDRETSHTAPAELMTINDLLAFRVHVGDIDDHVLESIIGGYSSSPTQTAIPNCSDTFAFEAASASGPQSQSTELSYKHHLFFIQYTESSMRALSTLYPLSQTPKTQSAHLPIMTHHSEPSSPPPPKSRASS